MDFENLVLLGSFENQSPEWYEARKGAIGGSQVGTIMGFNPWESPLTCFHKMRGDIPDSVKPNQRMRLGTLLEEPLMQLFAEEHPDWKVIHQPGTYAHKEFSYLHANPDGFYVDEHGVLHLIEVKTSRDFWQEIPKAYFAQVQFYMWMFGILHCKIVALTAGDYNEYDVEFDPFFADAMLLRLNEFYALVEANKRPDWDGSDSTYQTMRSLNSGVSEDRVEIAEMLGIDLVNTACEIDDLSIKLTELKSRVLDQMGDARVAYIEVLGEQMVVAKKQSRKDGVVLMIQKGKK